MKIHPILFRKSNRNRPRKRRGRGLLFPCVSPAAALAAALLLMTFFSGAACAENLLENGSFEELDEKGLPTGWETDAYVLEAGYTAFSAWDEDAVDGEHSVLIRNIGDNDARFCQTVEVEPESLYCFSGYIRTEEVEGGRGANLSIEGLYAFSESVYDTSDGWEYIEWYGETGEEQEYVTLFARLGGYSGESRGRAWFDDLRLEKVSAVPGSQIADRWYHEEKVNYYDENEEADAGSSASPAWPRLILLSLFYTVAAILTVQWLARRKEEPGMKKDRRWILWCGLGLALILRLVISYYVTGYMVDVNCFSSWGATMAQHGPAGFYPETNFCDYPPAYTYVLGINSLIIQAIPGISSGMTRVVQRFFPSVCDLLACIVLDRFFRKHRPEIPSARRTAVLLLFAFHPSNILNSAAWGQMDSALSLLILLVAIYAIEEKWEICLPCYMLAVLVKPQALMLGFLGLAALILCWIRKKDCRKGILRGCLIAVGVLLAVVVPFSLRQEPFWIVSQYAGTLASYPYASVNTANFYYLMNGNWSGIDKAAPVMTHLILAALTAGYGVWWYVRGRRFFPCVWAESTAAGVGCAWYLFCAFSGASWGMAGTAAMVMAFVIVLSLYIRKGDIRFLPYTGGLLFLILYVFGIKMHERYIFPAFLLFALAYGLRRDRRILTLFLTVTCTAFINEGIVLDNSIRLGSSLGHLNSDTVILAMILSSVNCLATLYAVFLGIDLSVSDRESVPVARWLHDSVSDNRLHWKRKDTAILAGILGLYSILSFGTLGSTKAPQTAWTSTDFTEKLVIDLGEERESFNMLYFCRVSRYDFSVAVSRDGENWEEDVWAQMDQGQCWKWKYVTDSTDRGDGTRSYGSSRHWFSGRYVRITAHQINLSLCEVIFRDENGRILPVAGITRLEGDPESELYSDPRNAIDEQDTLEAMPVYFSTSEDASEGEANPRTAQPSWWNSTYFDEIYHARTAWEFLTSGTPYETSHPPLGKVLMSWGVALFGMTPFGWRFAGAAAGVAMLAVLYLIVKQMTKKTVLAGFACGLFALDCMHLTQTQIATIDSFPVLFILLAFFFMLRFLQTDWRTAKRSRVLTDLGLSGFSMGLAIASKWIGIYAGAGLAVLFFWHGFRVCRQDERERRAGAAGLESISKESALRIYLGYCLWCILFFIAVPAGIYLVSYLPYFAYRHFTHIGDYLQAVLNSQQGMLNYHSTPGLGMDHPFYSPWYEWPIIGKPMFYSTKQYIYSDELSFSIFCFGNPVIWWAGIPAMITAAWMWIRNREESIPAQAVGQGSVFSSLDTNLVFLLIGFLAQYLPWTLVPRGTYIYHYFASVPFLIIAITLGAEQLLAKHSRTGKVFITVFCVLAFAAFILFFPYVTGILAPVSWLDAGKLFLHIWY